MLGIIGMRLRCIASKNPTHVFLYHHWGPPRHSQMGRGKLDPGSISKFHGRFCWQRGRGVLVQHGPTVCYVSSWTDCGVSAWYFKKECLCGSRGWAVLWSAGLAHGADRRIISTLIHLNISIMIATAPSIHSWITSTGQHYGMISFAYVVRGLAYVQFSLEVTVSIIAIL